MLSKKYNFLEAEGKWQRFWEEEGIYKFNKDGEGPVYSIDTPPPTVSGSIHIGHVYSYTQAEIIARFWRMKGYRVFYPFGFDDNGLPTERLVEREQNVKAALMDREDFNGLCLATTKKYEAEFKKLWQSLGFSVDWSLEYSTIDKNSQRVSQLSFVDLYNKGKVYLSDSPVIWCPQCETSIAQAEVEMKEVETEFNYIRFRTISGEELIIATTRPELLPACVGILVHPEDKRYQHLIGKKVIIPLTNEEVFIIADEDVERDKGTGAVMCCTFGDGQDIIWFKRHNFNLKELIDKKGRIKPEYPYAHMTLKEAKRVIIEDLKKSDYLLKQEKLNHQVAHHERCGQPIEYLTSKQWFIKIMDEKEKLSKAADEINWHPEYMKHRYTEWVQNLQWDWCISRQRYFGVPFPVWYCAKCGEIIIAEKDKLPVNPLKDSPEKTCKCGSREFIPEKDVMDTWATSAVTPLINARWKGEDELEYEIIPMNLRPQAHEIIRTWAFYTILKSLYHFNQIPWKDIMISGYVMAKKGEKISKSKGNAKSTPEELIKNYSADVLRLWTAQAKLGTDIFFSEEEVKNNQRLPIKLWNAARFVLNHLKDFDFQQNVEYELMDKWVLLELKETHKKVTEALEDFELNKARDHLDRFFFRDFCDNYLEIVKERLYKPEVRGYKKRLAAQKTLYICLFNILKMYAIFMPHITEEIYQNYYREKEKTRSIHLINWGKYMEYALSSTSEISWAGSKFIEIAAEVRKFKSEEGISLGTEVKRLTIFCDEKLARVLIMAEDDLKAVTKAQKLVWIIDGEKLKIEIDKL